MYNLLIVDDEPIMVEGLCEVIENSFESDIAVYKAYSGVEAINSMEQVKIDIVVTDICMPGMSGIGLCDKILLRWPRCKVIFLTGYNEIDYAKKAIRNGCVDYILKTEEDAVIFNAIEKAIQMLEDEKSNKDILKKAVEQMRQALPLIKREQMRQALPLIKRDFLLDILEGRIVLNSDVETKLNELGICFNPRIPVLLIVGKVDEWIADQNKQEVFFGVQGIMENFLDHVVNLESVVYGGDKLVWILQPKIELEQENTSKMDKRTYIQAILFIHENLHTIYKVCIELLRASISFVVSSEYCFWDKVSFKFRHFDSMLGGVYGLGKGRMLSENHIDKFTAFEYKKIRHDQMNPLNTVDKEEFSKLKIYLDNGSREDFMATIHRILTLVEQTNNISKKIVAENFYSIALVFLSYLNNSEIEASISKDIDLDRMIKINNFSNWGEVYSYFMQLAELIFENIAAIQTHSTERVIGCIQKYIVENISADLSMVKLGDLVHLNTSYLSRLYKKVTGQNMSDYIIDQRIRLAKELLAKDKLRISEIAESMGFSTHAYFTRFYKKQTGLSPQEYRNGIAEDS